MLGLFRSSTGTIESFPHQTILVEFGRVHVEPGRVSVGLELALEVGRGFPNISSSQNNWGIRRRHISGSEERKRNREHWKYLMTLEIFNNNTCVNNAFLGTKPLQPFFPLIGTDGLLLAETVDRSEHIMYVEML